MLYAKKKILFDRDNTRLFVVMKSLFGLKISVSLRLYFFTNERLSMTTRIKRNKDNFKGKMVCIGIDMHKLSQCRVSQIIVISTEGRYLSISSHLIAG